MRTFKEFVTKEDVGTNVGSIAGSGDARLPADQREPGLYPAAISSYQKKNKKGAKEAQAQVAVMVRRNVLPTR